MSSSTMTTRTKMRPRMIVILFPLKMAFLRALRRGVNLREPTKPVLGLSFLQRTFWATVDYSTTLWVATLSRSTSYW